MEMCASGTGIDEEDVISKEQKTIDGKTVGFLNIFLYTMGQANLCISVNALLTSALPDVVKRSSNVH